MDAHLKLIDGNGGTFPDLLDTENANTDTFGNTADESTNKETPTLKEPPSGRTDVGRILRTFKIKKNVEVTDNGKIII